MISRKSFIKKLLLAGVTASVTLDLLFKPTEAKEDEWTHVAVVHDGGEPKVFFDGVISDVGRWDRALSEEEVKMIYNNGSGQSFDGAGSITYWKKEV